MIDSSSRSRRVAMKGPQNAERAMAVANYKCQYCGRDAECFGEYEDSRIGAACSVCCGHANEDGWCVYIKDALDEVSKRYIEEKKFRREDFDALEKKRQALRKRVASIQRERDIAQQEARSAIKLLTSILTLPTCMDCGVADGPHGKGCRVHAALSFVR